MIKPLDKRCARVLAAFRARGIALTVFVFANTASALSPALAQRILFVDVDATGAANGTSWADAHTSLQDALAEATSGDEIWVAAGTYYPDRGGGVSVGDRRASFTLSPGVALFGGFSGDEDSRGERDPGAHNTILSGDLAQDDNENVHHDEPSRADNSYHVVEARAGPASSPTVLDGFVVSGGNAVQEGVQSGLGFNGGGLLALGGGSESRQDSVLHLRNMRFVRNSAEIWGGGLLLMGIADVSIEHVVFESNTASRGGGAYSYISRFDASDVGFFGNKAHIGGALYALNRPISIIDAEFVGNEAASWAGAVQASGTEMQIWNALFAENRTGSLEGGALVAAQAEVLVVNSVFTGNSAQQHGGAYASYASRVTLKNTTLSGNRAEGRGGAGYTTDTSFVYNSIFWNNESAQGAAAIEVDDSYDAAVAFGAHNILQSGMPAGMVDDGGNLFEDPLFTDAAGQDGIIGTADDVLTLSAASPAVDAGSNELLPLDALDIDGDGNVDEPAPFDFAGSTRIVDGGTGSPVVDIGAYEFGDIINRTDDHNAMVARPHLDLSVFPNPFAGDARVEVRAATPGSPMDLKVEIFDLLGRRIKTLFAGRVRAHEPVEFMLDGHAIAAGCYVLAVRAADERSSTIFCSY